MDFEELSQELQQTFLNLYKEHIQVCKSILEKDRCLALMLRINSASDPKLISLQSIDGKVDFLKLVEKTKEILNSRSFDTALLSYSSSNVLKESEAVVTYLFDKTGVGVLYYTAYHFSGFFKKKVVFDKHLLGDVIADAL